MMQQPVGKARGCKSRGREKGKNRAPRNDLHYRRERPKGYLDLLDKYLLKE